MNLRLKTESPLAVVEVPRGLVIGALGLVVAFFLVQWLWPLVLLFITATIFMFGMLPLVGALERQGLTKRQSVSILLLGLLLVTVGVLGIVLPPLVREARDLQTNLPESARQLEQLTARVGIHVQLQESAKQIDWSRVISGSRLLDLGQQALLIVGALFLAFVLAASMILDLPPMIDSLLNVMPGERRSDLERLFALIGSVVRGYLLGRLLTSLLTGLYTTVLLTAVGVPDAIAYGTIAAFTDVVPEIGPVVGVVVSTGAALQHSGTKAVIVLVFLLIYHQFEGRILIPKVFSQTLDLPALVVFIAVLGGWSLLGLVGVLLALPFIASLKVVIDYTLEARRSRPHWPGGEDDGKGAVAL